MQTCKICGCKECSITYKGKIRDGSLNQHTKHDVTLYRCSNCDAIWHEPLYDLSSYYQSKEYRLSLENTTDERDFYLMHDGESMDKFQYTGTRIFRDKIVADIGCGCGAFLDYINGVANEVIAIEPSEYYREIMNKKGFITYAYMGEALEYLRESIDIIVSFDVIEHVEDPFSFISQAYELLKKGGTAIIGTPTDAPIMRELLEKDYEMNLLFSTQHLWILGKKSLEHLASRAGVDSMETRYFQRYGIQNLIGWMCNRKPKSEIYSDWMTSTLDAVYRKQVEAAGLSDYIVLYMNKSK